MTNTVTIRLVPLDVTFAAERGSLLRSSIAAYGVDLPCGGARACGGCGVRVLDGSPAATAWDRDVFSRAELADGWRLACRMRAETDLLLDVGGVAALPSMSAQRRSPRS
jgi:Na+-transporting NADH:ubiquinone oxidoreductase subunit F